MASEPVPTVAGEDVPGVSVAGLPSDFCCSLLKWVDGRRYFRRHGPGVRVMRQVGQVMATMHRHAEEFTAPNDFRCPTWNCARLFGSPRAHGDVEWPMLDARGRRLFREAEQRVREAADALGTDADVFGVIHGDLIQANYVIHGDKLGVIDFADFGYGHYLYDMGITLFGLWGLDEDQRQRNAFLAGYREVRSLPFDHQKVLDLFIAARAVVQARFVMESQHPADQRMAPRYIRKVIDGLTFWLSGR